MRTGRRTTNLVVAGMLAAALAGPQAAGAASGPAPVSPASPATASPVTVTLITGDRVTVTGSGAVVVERGEGRSGISFTTDDGGGRLRVFPSDAFAPLREGRLDPRLFDVTTLAEFGYDDRRGDLPLIVTGSGTAAKNGLRSAMTASGARVTRDLAAVDGVAVRAPRKDRARFWNGVVGGAHARSGGVEKVWLDGLRRPSLDTSVGQIGAPAAWESGHTGAGVKVAVLDTGVDATHPDLAGRIGAQANFTEASGTGDPIGHGTHVASTIAGSGAASEGKYRGVAPGAEILDGRVCEGAWCEESAILAGMQWAGEQGAKVANLSLGTSDVAGIDPLELAVATVTERYGTLFVVAAGNAGADRSVSSPASADAALAVGAVTKSETPAEFSSRGPRVGDSALKPEITAPGVDITAARSKDSPGGGSYTAMSGTSMATPHVAGAAAILAAQHPDWTPATLKAALMGSARPNPALGIFAQGAGRVDVARATTQSVTAEPGGVSFGMQQWPHGDDAPITRKVTYRNPGTSPVTLALSVENQGEHGPFTVSPATVTVPAGGRADVSVTATTGTRTPEGGVGGHLVAAGDGGVRVSTPLAVENEIESYTLTLKHTGRDGEPSTSYFTVLDRIDVWETIFLQEGDDTVTLRLPRGRWEVSSSLLDRGQGNKHVTHLIHPGLDLTGDQTLELDARLGRPLSVTVPNAAAVQLGAQMTYTTSSPRGTLTRGFITDRFENMSAAQLGPDRTYDGVTTKVGGLWAQADAGGGTEDSPRTYDLAWFHEGGMVTGFRRAVARRDLAAIHADYAAHLSGVQGRASRGAQPAEGRLRLYLTETGFGTPSAPTHYVNTDGGARWMHFLREYGPDGEKSWVESSPVSYTPGRAYRESWNRGVFCPALPPAAEDSGVLTRTGDTIRAHVPPYGDGAGRIGWAATTKARTALYRDGDLVAELPSTRGEFTVPADAAGYRLVMESERGAPAVLSTRTSTAWTFRSEHAGGEAPLPLPISVVRFSPTLDAHNTAPGGGPYSVPVSVRQQAGSGAGKSRDLVVEVSYDDGATWGKAKVHKGEVSLRHPAAGGFASLRATSTDTAGNTVEQTVIRAYRIAPAN
ncbi:S8 family serine peptidase [Streptosporangium sp. NBC_01495]|uniref:S8 family serine peptidase n=1 Tax=Streptosporangium sp. NBC_01495 TaxID=2903899 RepID=UPI002E345A7E|nr:S8 family serine peptidase [Streptosporangium sp. NBC_01495]